MAVVAVTPWRCVGCSGNDGHGVRWCGGWFESGYARRDDRSIDSRRVGVVARPKGGDLNDFKVAAFREVSQGYDQVVSVGDGLWE